MKCVHFGYTYKIRTYINILLYRTIFHNNIAYFWQLRDTLAYDAVRPARTPYRMIDVAGLSEYMLCGMCWPRDATRCKKCDVNHITSLKLYFKRLY